MSAATTAPSPLPEPGGQQPSVTASWHLTLALYTGSVREQPASHSPYRRAYHTVPYPLPRAPSCRPNSAQSQLARARAVGLVTGSHAHTPRTHSQWVAGPGRTPQGRAVGHGRAPNPRRPTPRQEVPPPGALVPAPHRAKPARKSARCGVGDRYPHPHLLHPQPVDSGPRLHASRVHGRAPESADPGRPTPRQEAPPPGHPRAAPKARKAGSQERALWGW